MFDDRLKNLRKAKGATQADVAEALGIGESAYSNYEKDLREPNAVILKSMSRYFGVTIDYLLDCHTGFIASKEEQEHIKKYRTLDEHGKKIVDIVTDVECERMTEQKEIDISAYTRNIAAGTGEEGFTDSKINEVNDFAKQIYDLENDTK